MDTISKDFHQVYQFGVIADLDPPKRGQIAMVTQTPHYGSACIMFATDGVRTIRQLYNDWRATQNIGLEATARAAADTVLQENINTEAEARAGADTTLQGNIDTEASVTALVALILQDTAAMGIKESRKTIRQRMQEGITVIYNRGIKSGCTASKAGSGRKVVLAAGAVFAKGVEMPCPGDQAGIAVPANTGEAALVYYAYLTVSSSYAMTLAITEAGAVVPDGGIPICRLNVPAGSTAADLSDVTLTDARRYEPSYPTLVNSVPYASVALPYDMIDTGYAVTLDVTGYAGGWNQRPAVYAGEKASNGFKIFADGTLDEAIVQWKAIKLKL